MMAGGSPAYIQPGVHRHLIVPGAGGVEALARVPDALGQQLLDIHVDVLVVHGELHLVVLNVSEDSLQALYDLFRLVLLDDPLPAQHGSVRHSPVISCLYTAGSRTRWKS